ncbi:Fic family protein [Bifidobacterium sp. ESL0763]|uniref:Fic family protein n=1 Tax=Bifidobacterium sp. ESL0763 TaxID=2983227 RepID=UPI0023F7A539|nr:Fic family protein [Bifidobacterium sp. ESL0763]MDF7663112.1 Fic family protein [Bifidobacterium sp. ESL0763]
MSYKSISTMLHASSSTMKPADFAEQEYRRRLELPSTIQTDITLDGSHKVFAVLSSEAIMLISDILRCETNVERAWRQLPGVARNAYIGGLLVEELLSTNQMEGVRSTRQEVTKALQSAGNQSSHTRFSEFAKLYIGISQSESSKLPESLGDIRNIYDQVVDHELDDDDKPDGELFRKGHVGIQDMATGREIHRGLPTEAHIQTALTQMLAFMHADGVLPLLKAIICHYAFEYIHPFYDGNGRTGRFLLALQLRKYLSAPTALSLSPVIAEGKQAYYKAFEDAENPLNCSEVSFFVIQMLQFIQTAQHRLDENLTEKENALDTAQRAATEFSHQHGLDALTNDILSMLIQQHLFHQQVPQLTRALLARYEGVGQARIRTKLGTLLENGLVSTVGKRPIYYQLSHQACELFGLHG